MARLATVDDVQDIIRNDITEVGTTIEFLLDAMSPVLEDKIRTTFDSGAHYDIFSLNDNLIKPDIYQYHWRLSNGFIDSTEDFTVLIADTIEDFDSSSTYTDVTDRCIIDYTKGTVSLIAYGIDTNGIRAGDSRLIGNFVKISYTSGFAETAGVYTGVPDWLQKAACFGAIVQLDAISPTLRHNEENENFSLNQLKGVFNSLFTGRIRYYPRHQNPIIKV